MERKVQINFFSWVLYVVDAVFYDFSFDLLFFFVEFAAFCEKKEQAMCKMDVCHQQRGG